MSSRKKWSTRNAVDGKGRDRALRPKTCKAAVLQQREMLRSWQTAAGGRRFADGMLLDTDETFERLIEQCAGIETRANGPRGDDGTIS